MSRVDGVEQRPVPGVPTAGDRVGGIAAEDGGGLGGGAESDQLGRLRDLDRPARQGLHHPAPGGPSRSTPDEDDGGLGVEAGAVGVDDIEGFEQRQHGSLVCGEQDLAGLGGVAQPGDRRCRVGEVRGPFTVEVGEHDDLGVLGGGVAVEAEPAGDPVDGERAVEGAGQGEESPRGVGEPGHAPGGIHGAGGGAHEGGARGAEADDRDPGSEAQPDRRAGVVAGPRADGDPRPQAQVRGGRRRDLAGGIARSEHPGEQ